MAVDGEVDVRPAAEEVPASTAEASGVVPTDFKMAAKDAPPDAGVALEAGFTAGAALALATAELLCGSFNGGASGAGLDPAARLLKNAALALAIDTVGAAGETAAAEAVPDSNILAVMATEIFDGTETIETGRLSSEAATEFVILVWLVDAAFEVKIEPGGVKQEVVVRGVGAVHLFVGAGRVVVVLFRALEDLKFQSSRSPPFAYLLTSCNRHE